MQDQQSASYNYNEIGDYGTDADFADESVYPVEEAGGGEAGGEGLVALNHQQDDGPYGVVKKYQDDHVCNIQYDVSRDDTSLTNGRIKSLKIHYSLMP